MSFANALLDETGVAVVPGDDFGGCGPEHIRLSFACSEDNITAGLTKAREWLTKFE